MSLWLKLLCPAHILTYWDAARIQYHYPQLDVAIGLPVGHGGGEVDDLTPNCPLASTW